MAVCSRHFADVSNSLVVVSLGSVGVFGPGSLAVVCKASTIAANGVLLTADPADVWTVRTDGATDKINLWNGTVDVMSLSTLATGVWCVVVVTKATGSVAPRFHFYNYSTKVWVHENGAANAANSGTPATSSSIGCDTSGQGFEGDIQAVGYWNRALTDAECEAMPMGVAAWQALTPRAMWVLNQTLTTQAVRDQIGNAAQTSTTATTIVAGNPDFADTDAFVSRRMPLGV